MNKIIKIFMVILAVSVLTLTFVACEQSCPDGEHNWSEWVSTATCTEGGVETRTCSICGKIEKHNVEALGHEEEVLPATATCTDGGLSEGVKCSRCGVILVEQKQVGAYGHDFANELNYFTYTQCRRCEEYFTLDSNNIYSGEFIYDFDDDAQTEIDNLYQEIEDAINGLSNIAYSDFVELFDAYDSMVSYIQAQYQFAKIDFDINYDTNTRNNYMAISEYYNLSISRYYSLFKQINESKYGSYFWEWTEWDQDEIQEVLALADSYDLDNQNAVDEISRAYEEFMDSIGWASIDDPDSGVTNEQKLQLFDLYSQLVVANNNIATTAGFDNYMEYAYANVYERDYSPSDATDMRNYVKEYIGPVLKQVNDAYMDWTWKYNNRGGWKYRASQTYYSIYVGDYLFRDMDALYAANDLERVQMVVDCRDSIAEYFQFLSSNQTDGVNFYNELIDLFANGNYFLGTNPNTTAYTWYIYSLDIPMLLFTDEYKDAFTFIHEFGHYFQFAYNGRLGVSLDQDETQSQGNEMLFLAYLREHLPQNQNLEEGFEILELEQLRSMLGTIVMSTAVDEFEYLVYTGATTFNGQPIPTVQFEDGSTIVDYATLYKNIMKSYWSGITEYYNTAYWSYVVFDQAGYYISYAMSALPALEIYAKSGIDGLEAARDSYLKLFTFSNNNDFVSEKIYDDGYVERNLTASYETILNWAGLDGPFQKDLYTTIAEFFANR